jgi:hypothetical protein
MKSNKSQEELHEELREELREGRTSDELREYLDNFTSLSAEQKNELVQREERREERLRKGRTLDELREYLDNFVNTSLSAEQKNELVQLTINSESSFTHLEELVFNLYH